MTTHLCDACQGPIHKLDLENLTIGVGATHTGKFDVCSPCLEVIKAIVVKHQWKGYPGDTAPRFTER